MLTFRVKQVVTVHIYIKGIHGRVRHKAVSCSRRRRVVSNDESMSQAERSALCSVAFALEDATFQYNILRRWWLIIHR